MQVQRDQTLLLDGVVLRGEDFAPTKESSASLDSYTLKQKVLNSVEHLTCSGGNNVLAATYLNNSKQILIFDLKTKRMIDRFPLKSCDRKFSRQSFEVRAVQFSPDASRLAIGQTDCIIYIYKLPDYQCNVQSSIGSSANNKPTITGKFICSSPVSCLIWVEIGIIFGTQDGKIKLISLSSMATSKSDNSAVSSSSATKVSSIYSPSKSIVPIALALRHNLLAVSYLDSSVFLTTLSCSLQDNSLDQNSNNNNSVTITTSEISNQLQQQRRSSSLLNSLTVSNQMIHLSSPAYEVAIMQSNTICCAAADGKVSVYSLIGQSFSCLQNFELKDDITALDYSPINEMVVISTSGGKLMFLKSSPTSDQQQQTNNSWQLQESHIELADNVPTTLCWTRDGCQLIAGTCLGHLQVFRCTWTNGSDSAKETAEKLDICHIARNRVRITDRARNLLATYKTRYDIKRLNMLDNGQSVIIWTTNSLLLARLDSSSKLQSEIPWTFSSSRRSQVKFCFNYAPDYVLVYNITTRELSVIELGKDSPVFRVKLERSLVSHRKLCVRKFPSSTTPTPAHAQYQQQITDHQSDNSSRSVQEINLPLEGSGEQQRFAYVNINNNSSNLLSVVNLKRATEELIVNHVKPINFLALSYSVRKLIFCDHSAQLFLVKFDQKQLQQHRGPSDSNYQILLAKSCIFATWLPNSDILIAQSSYNILIWYDLDDVRRKCEEYDVRYYNVTGKPPIVDLSSIASHSLLSLKESLTYPVIKSVSAESLELSNNYKVQLNKLKVRFYTEIHQNKLLKAKELLLQGEMSNASISASNHLISLWSKLGWLAIEQNNCDIAISVFKKINFNTMVNYLAKCMQQPAEESAKLLAMLKGDWFIFEELSDLEQVVATYKRLNKWSRLMEYLLEKQQFRQRDLIEQEYRDWLISKGRLVEAASLQTKSGDLFAGIELLLGNCRYEEAANLLISERKSSSFIMNTQLNEQIKGLQEKLIENNSFLSAAKLAHLMLNRHSQALELYLKAGAFDLALELAHLNADEQRVLDIEEQFAKHLINLYNENKVSRRKALPAINHYISAKKPLKAAQTAVQLKDFNAALNAIKVYHENNLQELETPDVKQLTKSIGDHFSNAEKSLELAIEAYLIGGYSERVLELYIQKGSFEKAYELTLQMNSNNTVRAEEQFLKLADKFVASEEQWHCAESIYLLLNKSQMAIELQKEHQNYERYLELISQYQPEQLESSLLLLAKQFEASGDFETAERYLLRASSEEWVNVVRMYRLAGRWQDAYRVARLNCSSEREPLLVQLAYWWCKSIENQKSAKELLKRLQVYDLVVEFCCESKNFQLAIELASSDESEGYDEQLRASLVRRYAAHLEEQQLFGKAEELLLRNNQLESAVQMYIDNDMHSDAIRVVEETLKQFEAEELQPSATETELDISGTGTFPKRREQLVELLNKTLVQCANRLVEEVGFGNGQAKHSSLISRTDGASDGKLVAAQQLYLRAQRPELAVQMYTERARWQEAVQVAQRFAPQLLESVEKALDEDMAEGLAPIVAVAESARLASDHLSRTSSSHSSGSPLSGSGSNNLDSSNQMSISVKARKDHLSNRAEAKLLNGNSRETKLALNEFMDSLVVGGPQRGFIGELLDQIEQLVNTGVINKRVIELTDTVIEQSGWNGQVPSEAQLSIWMRLRRLLIANMSSLRADNKQVLVNQITGELEQRLLLVHCIHLQGRLLIELERILQQSSSRARLLQTGQPMISQLTPSKVERLRSQLSSESQVSSRELVELIAKQSLALLRYTNLLDSQAAFYASGIWLLLSNQRQQTQIIWRRLLELVDNTSPSGMSTGLEEELERFGIPAPAAAAADGGSSSSLSAAQVSAVREWLLEALIEDRTDSASPSTLLSEVFSKNNNNNNSSKHFKQSNICLLCGSTVSPNDAESLGTYQVCSAEWRRFQQLSLRLKRDSVGRNGRRGVGVAGGSVRLTEFVELKIDSI